MSHFVKHISCPKCGSSDGRALYSNQSSFCFVCNSWFSPDGELKEVKSITKALLNGLEPIGKTLRGIRADTFEQFGYRYGDYKGKECHVATYRNLQGKKVAQHIRLKGKEFRWVGDSHYLQLFGQHRLKAGGKRVVITEGEFDCLTISQVFNNKWQTVSLPSGAQSAVKYVKMNLEYVESFDEVVLAFDSDEPGQKAAEEVALLLTPGKAKIASWLPFKDANEMLQARQGSQIATRIFEAQVYRPDGIVLGADITLEEVLTPDEEAEGYTIPYSELNAMLRGLRKRELHMLCSGSGSGKSTLSKELGYHLVTEHGLKVAHIALEEAVKKSILAYIALDNQVPFGDLYMQRDILDKDKLTESYQKLIASNKMCFYNHFGSLDSGNLLSKLRYLAVGLEVDFIILDHISIVVSGMELRGDERKTIDKLMTDLRSLCENTGVGIIAISHLSNPQGGRKAHEDGGRITINDLRGSGSIKQLSDNIIGIERDQQGANRNVSTFRLLKNRLFGETGYAGKVEYNPFTGRLENKNFERKSDNFEKKNDRFENDGERGVGLSDPF